MLHCIFFVVVFVLGSTEALARAIDGTDPTSVTAGLDEDGAAQDEVLELLTWQLEQGDLEATRAILSEVLEPGARALVVDLGGQDALSFLRALDVIARRIGDLDAELGVWTEIHRRLDASLDSDDYELLAAKLSLATARKQLGDLEGALELEEHVHAAFSRLLPPDHRDLLGAKLNLARTCREMGDLDRALVLEEYAHAARERLLTPDHPDLLYAKNNLALTRRELGDLEGALALQEYVHAAWERLQPLDYPALLGAKLNLAATRYRLGDLEGAHALFEHVHGAQEQLLPADHPDLLITKLNLAVTRKRLSDLEGASALEEHVHSTLERLLAPDHPDLLRAKLNLALTRSELGDPEGALALLNHVHAARERHLGPDHPDLLRAKLNIAKTQGLLGDLEGALALLEHSHDAWERLLPPDHPDLLDARLSLSALRRQLGDLERAYELSLSLGGATSEFVASGLTVSPREARATAQAAAQRLAKGRFWNSSDEVPAAVRSAYMRAFETTRHVAAARFELRRGTDSDDGELTELRSAAASARRALDEHITRVPHAPERGPDQSEEEWKRGRDVAQGEWNRTVKKLSLERDDREKELLAALGGSRSLVTSIDPARLSTALEENDVAIGLHRIDCWTWDSEGGDGTHAGEHYVAYAIAANGEVSEIDLGSATEIDAHIERWRRALGTSLGLRRGFGSPSPASAAVSEVDDVEAGRALRRSLLDPLVAACKIEPGARLFVCLDDSLHAVPLDALPLDAAVDGLATAQVGSDVARVGDVYRIRSEVSFARLIAPDGPVETPNSLLLVGGVDYYDLKSDAAADPRALEERILAQASGDDRAGGWGEWAALPGASKEAAQIGELAQEALEVEAATLGANAVTADAIARLAAGKKYVHIATHGWFMPESVRSMLDHDPSDERMGLLGTERAVTGFAPLSLCGLVMSGASAAETSRELSSRLLTALELSTFDLWHSELAVLSACETNVGVARAGQGIQSLQTALHQAGARASVTSLWRVDDDATRDLMRAFYANLWVNEMGKAEALWDAKCQLRRRGEPVRHWAGWVLVGDPD
ncbi:MAG: CHAT domain-containing tetratricopeptide repeat protein [Planctomycetota bacterium]